MKEVEVAGMFVSGHSGHRKGLVWPQPRCRGRGDGVKLARIPIPGQL